MSKVVDGEMGWADVLRERRIHTFGCRLRPPSAHRETRFALRDEDGGAPTLQGERTSRQLLLKLSGWQLGASVPGLTWHSRSIPGLLVRDGDERVGPPQK